MIFQLPFQHHLIYTNQKILLGIQHLSMKDQEKHLLNFILQWQGSTEQIDDILVIGIRL
jgi:hypothetical protein